MKLVVIDDIGLLPVATDAADGLYRVADAAYERRSIAIPSNLHPAGFDELMPETLATATVDLLLHHAHVCQTSGDSIRLTQALTGKGVTQLNEQTQDGQPQRDAQWADLLAILGEFTGRQWAD